jgi:hypothetical protein
MQIDSAINTLKVLEPNWTHQSTGPLRYFNSTFQLSSQTTWTYLD